MNAPSISLITRMRRATFINEGIAMLVMLMVLLKGFIPVGYMPDMEALQKGVVKITICTASGFEEKLVDSVDKTAPAKSHHATSDFCPFGWAPHAVTAPISVFLIPEIFLVPERLIAFQKLFLSKPHHTVASPRAPPAYT
ncbi:MAG: DUF2946 family protein [Alphaproteobacteria bacterium]|nr:DUF2946 family protein [Alphaproteobacteria bacterium]